jgi:hypothetical protein
MKSCRSTLGPNLDGADFARWHLVINLWYALHRASTKVDGTCYGATLKALLKP